VVRVVALAAPHPRGRKNLATDFRGSTRIGTEMQLIRVNL
jgi:hypothetical protein